MSSGHGRVGNQPQRVHRTSPNGQRRSGTGRPDARMGKLADRAGLVQELDKLLLLLVII